MLRSAMADIPVVSFVLVVALALVMLQSIELVAVLVEVMVIGRAYFQAQRANGCHPAESCRFVLAEGHCHFGTDCSMMSSVMTVNSRTLERRCYCGMVFVGRMAAVRVLTMYLLRYS